MTSSETRNSFLKFFEQRGHTIVPSSPVIPFDDPTLLFTNAGMNQFKDVFLGTGKRSYRRAVDTQKCIRVSGKHNDLEEVGRDTYHHTFFEMLGNWSFGDYYKKEAIEWAWELLTKDWGLSKKRLWATVYKDDDEAEKLWKSVTDIDHSHVLRFGEKDNFWEMGETGPCGPCSEIHMDRTPKGNADASMVNAGLAEVMEIWNLVFIQYDRDPSGKFTPLPAKHVDTGMGFERMCAVLQNKKSNYDTDVFMPLVNELSKLVGKAYHSWVPDSPPQVAMRAISDHVRAITFAIADGALPSNDGRGYVVRRLLRRASIFRKKLNAGYPLIHKLVPVLVDIMGNVFPEIKIKQDFIQRIIFEEEENFNKTLDRGIDIHFHEVKRAVEKGDKIFSGDVAFKLHDTYGFPIDETQRLAKDHKLEVDIHRFDQLMEIQRQRSRTEKPNLFGSYLGGDTKAVKTEFIGYNHLEVSPQNYDIKIGPNKSVEGIVFDITPFYPESGGQVSDTGVLKVGENQFRIIDVRRVGDQILHLLEPGVNWTSKEELLAVVDKPRRLSIMRNHTATHLVHEALRQVLGEHLHQHGSLVDDKHLRFDFNHFDKVSPEQLQAIEDLVNEKISGKIVVQALNDPKDWVSIDEAKKRWPNVKMFFGDKYGDKVRVVVIDPKFSVELCGGTHVKSTSEIGFFRFRTEGSVASGIRRIEAVTHEKARELYEIRDRDTTERIEYALGQYDETEKQNSELEKLSGGQITFGGQLSALVIRLTALKLGQNKPKGSDLNLRWYFDEQSQRARQVETLILELFDIKKSVEKELAKYRVQSMSGSIEQLVKSGIPINGFRLVSSKISASSAEELKSLGDTLRAKLGSGVGLLAAVIDDKVSLVCVVTDDLVASRKVEAGKIVGAVAKLVGGGGGGRPHMATAGGKDVAKLDEALAQTKSIVESLLHKS